MDTGLALLVRQYHHGQHEEGGRGLGLSRQMSNDPYLQPDDLSLTADNNNDPDNRNIDQDETFLTPKLTYKTVVAPDDEVTNGFVKDKRFLPYVFEANEEGIRKQSSKVLPICGVCGKEFVCVTTMKRHMVTHTGEKPFSCKVCGKQYTQKGNLRVHERTHRNDRPFVCSICFQKFYRKEPMQKHQRRQHGMVSLKSGGTTRKESPQTMNATDISMKSLLTAVAKVESANTNQIQCAGCRTQFHQEQDLIAHLVIFSETLRPYNCCICNCRFSQLVYLTKHQIRVHSGEVEDENDDELELESGPLNLNKQQFVASSKDPAEDILPLDLSPSKKGISGNLNRRYSSILKDGSANDQPLAKKPRLRLSPNLLTSMPFLQKSEALDDPLSDIRNLPYYRHVLK